MTGDITLTGDVAPAGDPPGKSSKQAGQASEAPCIAATNARPPAPQAVPQGSRRVARAPQQPCLGFPKAVTGPAFKLGFTGGTPPLSCWKGEGGAESLINTVGCELGAIEVSLQRGRDCSSHFCWRSPWQEPAPCLQPPEKPCKDGGVFMERSATHGEGHRWWSCCKISCMSEVFTFFFFPHHKKSILEPHARLHGGVSAAQASCPPRAVGLKSRVGFSQWDKFKQNYQGDCQN